MKKLYLILILSLTVNAGSYNELDFFTQVALGKIAGYSSGHKFGENPDVDTGTVPEVIWDVGNGYTAPTADRTHDIASTSVADVGSLVSTGTITTYVNSTAIFTDSSADFVTDGVIAGDLWLDDTSQDHSVVISVTNLTTLVLEPVHHWITGNDYDGNTYRIVNKAGTGAAVLHIKQGDQKDGTIITEFVILNGTTNVATANAYYSLTRMHIHGVGAGGESAGDITATAQTDATVTAKILQGNGSTGMAWFHVPRGYTMLVYYIGATLHRTGVASDAMAEIGVYSELWRERGEGRRTWDTYGVSVNGGLTPINLLSAPIKISQDEDFWIEAFNVSDNDSHISARFNYILIDNDYL